ncbi:MAG: NUDIX hydrolase [Spirochaetales bacterium]|nr:NUDIX hydrolase [Spirochaetales bacterium]
MELTEKKLSGVSVYDGNLLHVRRDEVVLPNGRTASREFIRHPGAVAVVPVTDDSKVVVERQFRYPLGQVILEIPAGKIDPGEDTLAAAKRELEEETGYTASEWECIGTFNPSPAYTDELITLYLARGLKAGHDRMDEDEFLNVELMDLQELVSLIVRGEVPDGKTQTAVLLARERLSSL